MSAGARSTPIGSGTVAGRKVGEGPQDIVPVCTAGHRSGLRGRYPAGHRSERPRRLIAGHRSARAGILGFNHRGGSQMSEEELRKEAVRRHQTGERAEEIAAALGRTSRWVRKWSARALEETAVEHWAKDRSRAPHRSPARTPEGLRRAILEARLRLQENPRAQYGALAVAWELRRMGVDPIPGRWTIERVIA